MRYAKGTKLLSNIWKQIKIISINMIETEPTMSVSKIVNRMKRYTTYPI